MVSRCEIGSGTGTQLSYRHPNFTSTYCGLMSIQHCVLNVKVLVGTFNQEKALLRTFSVIVKTLPMVRLEGYTAGAFIKADADSVPNVFLQFQQYGGGWRAQHNKMDNSLINHESCSCYNYKIYICYHRSHNKLFLEPFRLSVVSRSKSNVVFLCSFYQIYRVQFPFTLERTLSFKQFKTNVNRKQRSGFGFTKTSVSETICNSR